MVMKNGVHIPCCPQLICSLILSHIFPVVPQLECALDNRHPNRPPSDPIPYPCSNLDRETGAPWPWLSHAWNIPETKSCLISDPTLLCFLYSIEKDLAPKIPHTECWSLPPTHLCGKRKSPQPYFRRKHTHCCFQRQLLTGQGSYVPRPLTAAVWEWNKATVA